MRAIQQSLNEFKHRIISNLEAKGIINLIVPIFDGSSHVECINPKLVSEADYKSALDIVSEANKELDKWINQQPKI